MPNRPRKTPRARMGASPPRSLGDKLYNRERRRLDPEQQRFYQSRAWSRLRQAILDEHPLCAHCTKKGIVRAAVDCDHIQSRKAHPDLALDPDNVEPLCKSCHSKKTRKGL